MSANGYPQPSFSSKAPAAFPSAPEEIIVARRKLREAAKTLYTLATYPREYLQFDVTFKAAIYPFILIFMTNCIPKQCLEMAALRYVSHFKIAQAIPIDQDITYAEAASKAGVDEGQLKRNVRLLIIIVRLPLSRTEARLHSACCNVKAPSY